MATEEWLLKAIHTGKNYEELPPRVRSILTVNEWKSRVKEYCIMRGLGWGDSQASQVSAEMEYYEELLRYSKNVYRLFPYHLSDFVTRVLRVTPFRYYCDVLYNALKEEKQYDQIPNFTAADIKRVAGIGRNEYIEILNQCKAKKLLWRVNKGIAREFLPSEPVNILLDAWWHVAVVNIGEMEYRALTPEELKTLQDACFPGGSQVSGLDPGVLMALYKRGLVYIEVPIAPDDIVSIPHLEGFVSNRDSAGLHADPMEQLLHQVFVAASENITVEELAEMLAVELGNVQAAVSVACRLHFAHRLPRPGGEANLQEAGTEKSGSDLDPIPLPGVKGSTICTGDPPSLEDVEGNSGAGGGRAEGSESTDATSSGAKAVALVVDATVTSYLMMGNLPGLKRHAVTLFEGGRVSGAEPMGSLITELQGVSEERLDMYEGEMQELMSHTAALAHALEFIQGAVPGGQVELLRRESLAGLSFSSTARLLSRAYSALLPVTPMPGHPLPLQGSNLVNFGPTVESVTPWMQLALGVVGGRGLPGLVFMCGQRVWRLPPQLGNATHALIWPWDTSLTRSMDLPVQVNADFLLVSLNDFLTRTAVFVQPLVTAVPPDEVLGGINGWQLDIVNVALPLVSSSFAGDEEGVDLLGVPASDGQELAVVCGAGKLLNLIVQQLGLQNSVGYIRLLRLSDETSWFPLDIHLGLPLFSVELCRQVCSNAAKVDLLSPENLQAQADGHSTLRKRLRELLVEHADFNRNSRPPATTDGDQEASATSVSCEESTRVAVDLPIHNLVFTGSELKIIDLSEYAQDVVPAFCSQMGSSL